MLGNISAQTEVEMADTTARVIVGFSWMTRRRDHASCSTLPDGLSGWRHCALGQTTQRPRGNPLLGNISAQTEVKMAYKTRRRNYGVLADNRAPGTYIPFDAPGWFAWSLWLAEDRALGNKGNRDASAVRSWVTFSANAGRNDL